MNSGIQTNITSERTSNIEHIPERSQQGIEEIPNTVR